METNFLLELLAWNLPGQGSPKHSPRTDLACQGLSPGPPQPRPPWGSCPVLQLGPPWQVSPSPTRQHAHLGGGSGKIRDGGKASCRALHPRATVVLQWHLPPHAYHPLSPLSPTDLLHQERPAGRPHVPQQERPSQLESEQKRQVREGRRRGSPAMDALAGHAASRSGPCSTWRGLAHTAPEGSCLHVEPWLEAVCVCGAALWA